MSNPGESLSPEIVAAWKISRHGSHAGRGFRYQDAVAADLATQAFAGDGEVLILIPEGLDDVTLVRTDGTVHSQVKSRRGYRGEFSPHETAGYLASLWGRHHDRLGTGDGPRLALILERPVSEKHLDRVEWLRDHVTDVVRWLDVDGDDLAQWTVEPLIVVDEELMSPFITDSPVQVRTYMDVRSSTGNFTSTNALHE